MSTYYQYQDAKVKIAHRLMKREGWEVFGYSASNSDPYTDYFDPANWHGIATKNGYVLVVDACHEVSEDVYREVITDAQKVADAQTVDKIKKLERMTQARGASEAEEATAKKKIEELKSKSTTAEGQAVEKILVAPAHKKNPPRCNWHIEKDGIIIDKGTGLLKFSNVPDVSGLGYSYEVGEWQKFNKLSPEEWKKDYIDEQVCRWGEAERARATASAESSYNNAVESYKLLDQFNNLIARWDNIAGGMVSNGSGTDGFIYEEVTKTEYKTELKPQQTEAGSVKDGQCFMLTASFNYGRNKGYVYRIRETFTRDDGTKAYTAFKLGKGYKKECTGSANKANSWYIFQPEDLTKWIDRGAIAWCELVEVKTPYEIKKVVKKVIKNTTPAKEQPTASEEPQQAPKEEKIKEIKSSYTYDIKKDIDTRDDSVIYCVKIVEKLDREEYKQVNSYMRELGGYYSRFKHAFIFKEDPTSQLQPAESEKEDVQPEELENVEKIDKKTEVPQPEPLGDIKNGYNKNDNSNFEKSELEKLINGENVTKSDSWRSCTYCTLPHPIYGNVKLVYSMYNSDLIAGNSLNYCGFIANNNYYCDNNKIMGKLKDDVNRCLTEKIPTELEAERLYQKYDKNNEYNKRDIEACKNIDMSLDAAKLFFDDEKPQLILYNILRDIPVETLISYIVEPDRTIEDVANEYMKERSCYIYRQYIMYNNTIKEYNRIINDKNSIEQLNKKIMQCINEEKTVRVLIDGIGEIKIDASGVKHIGYTRNISSWHVVASDRDKLKKESKYNYQSIEPQDIKQIKHGNKILYKAG